MATSSTGGVGGVGGYRTVMTLVIRDFRPAQDKGQYVCRAANSLGDAESSIQVYGNCCRWNGIKIVMFSSDTL